MARIWCLADGISFCRPVDAFSSRYPMHVHRIVSLAAHRADFKIDKTEGLFLKPFITAQPGSLNLSPAVWESLANIASNYPETSSAIYPEVAA